MRQVVVESQSLKFAGISSNEKKYLVCMHGENVHLCENMKDVFNFFEGLADSLGKDVPLQKI